MKDNRYKVLIITIIIYLVFLIAFLLYQLPLLALAYPYALSAFLIAIYFIYGHFKDQERLQELQKGQMPKAESSIEEEYQKLLGELKASKQKLYSKEESKYREMIDYYTTWVHQIKTPIASMKLTLQNEDSPAMRKISSDLLAIENYVEMVLAYLRLDSDNNDLVVKEVDLETLVRNVIRRFANDFINKKLKLTIELKEAKVLSDEKWLAFIIEQLLSNAIKYTSTGSILFSYKDNCLSLIDSGIGIDERDLPRIFEKGYTGYNGHQSSKSSGLGLYLVKRTADMLGIDITITSKVNEGTAVIISFPKPKEFKE